MALSQVEKILIDGLREYPISEENQRAIFAFLTNEEEQLSMIKFLMMNPSAKEQEILKELERILTLSKRLTNS
jgi:hypothetical protein